jgi:hypothetical protein
MLSKTGGFDTHSSCVCTHSFELVDQAKVHSVVLRIVMFQLIYTCCVQSCLHCYYSRWAWRALSKSLLLKAHSISAKAFQPVQAAALAYSMVRCCQQLLRILEVDRRVTFTSTYFVCALQFTTDLLPVVVCLSCYILHYILYTGYNQGIILTYCM